MTKINVKYATTNVDEAASIAMTTGEIPATEYDVPSGFVILNFTSPLAPEAAAGYRADLHLQAIFAAKRKIYAEVKRAAAAGRERGRR